MANKEQLRRLREKHKLGEYSPKFKKKSSSRISRRVRVKRTGGFIMAKKRRTTRSKGFLGGKTAGLMGNVIGIGGYIAYEAFISPKIPLAELPKSLLELGIGVFIMRKGGILGNIGKAMVTINAYQLMRAYLAPALMGVAGTNY